MKVHISCTGAMLTCTVAVPYRNVMAKQENTVVCSELFIPLRVLSSVKRLNLISHCMILCFALSFLEEIE